MGDLTNNLSRCEWACKCGCGFDTVDFHLPTRMQLARNAFARITGQDVRISITGGNRCRAYNDSLRALYQSTGGKEGSNTSVNSKHIQGRAADHHFYYKRDGKKVLVPHKIVYKYYNKTYQKQGGLGLYRWGVHIDTASRYWRNQ